MFSVSAFESLYDDHHAPICIYTTNVLVFST